jgi:hypothetical protein
MHTIFWLENPKCRDHSEDLGLDVNVILERILGKYCGNKWVIFMCLRMETNGSLL